MDVTTATDTALMTEHARLEELCARIVASVHGVIPLALANAWVAVSDEAEKRAAA